MSENDCHNATLHSGGIIHIWLHTEVGIHYSLTYDLVIKPLGVKLVTIRMEEVYLIPIFSSTT